MCLCVSVCVCLCVCVCVCVFVCVFGHVRALLIMRGRILDSDVCCIAVECRVDVPFCGVPRRRCVMMKMCVVMEMCDVMEICVVMGMWVVMAMCAVNEGGAMLQCVMREM